MPTSMSRQQQPSPEAGWQFNGALASRLSRAVKQRMVRPRPHLRVLLQARPPLAPPRLCTPYHFLHTHFTDGSVHSFFMLTVSVGTAGIASMAGHDIFSSAVGGSVWRICMLAGTPDDVATVWQCTRVRRVGLIAPNLQQGAEVGDGVCVRGLVAAPGGGVPRRLEPPGCFCFPLLLLPLSFPLLLLCHLQRCRRRLRAKFGTALEFSGQLFRQTGKVSFAWVIRTLRMIRSLLLPNQQCCQLCS